MIITNVKRSNYVRYHRSNLTDANFVRLAAKNFVEAKKTPLVVLCSSRSVSCVSGAPKPPLLVGQQRNCYVLTVTNHRKTEKTSSKQDELCSI